ncbi:hypothetical protein L596_011558 [Steinernema carpocapsae]|uniref:Uncharacterized protein n=1 Tax=Steinernema carpocapsae TaxID=34508 RepID=A0A4U5NUP5_STECR|nr:hypothetical protein L596_011558 [Steinernema carpocapsae]
MLFSSAFVLLVAFSASARGADTTAAFLRDYLSNVYPYGGSSMGLGSSLGMNPYSSSLLTSMYPYNMLSTNPMMSTMGMMGPYQSIYGMVDPYGMGSLGMPSPFRGLSNLGMGYGTSGLGMGMNGLGSGLNSLAGLNSMNSLGLAGLGGLGGLGSFGGLGGLGGLSGLNGMGMGISPFGLTTKRERESSFRSSRT